MFSTNMFRIQALIEIAAVTGRKLLLLGRSLQRNTELARDLGILKLPADVFVDERAARDMDHSELIIACTGSQAQPRAALARMAYDDLVGFKIEPGDHVVFSARSIPGNEGMIAHLHDQIVRRGGVIIMGGDVHCSGHACRDEQRTVLEAVRPKSFIPVHGDHRFLVAHAALASELQETDTLVLENGETVELDAKSSRRVGSREAPKVCVDITPFGYLHGEAVKTRRRLAQRGLAIVTLAINRETHALAEDPTIENLGLFDQDIEGPLLEDALDAAEDAFHDLSERDRLDEHRCGEAVRVAVMRLFRRETGRKPLVLPIIVYT
jgi:ribonuclease J